MPDRAPQRHRVMYDGLFTFVVRFLNMAGAAALGILTARLLGPTGKGLYAFPIVYSGLLAAGFSGLTNATSYYLLNRAPGRNILLPLATVTTLFVATAALGVAIIGWLGAQHWAILPAIIALPAIAVNAIAAGYAVGVKRVRYSSTITASTTFLTFVLMAAGLFFVARSASVAIVAWLCGLYAVALVCGIYVTAHALVSKGDDRLNVLEFARFASKVCAVSFMSLLNYRADLYIVALMLNPAALGMYTVAIAAAESLLVPTQVAALVTSPHIGSLDRGPAAYLTARCVRHNLFVAITVCGLLFILAPFVVGLLYGAPFLPMVPALRVLLVGVLILSLGAPMSNFFTLKLGKPEVALVLATFSAVCCVAVAVLLVPHFGLVGAALGSTFAYAIGNAAAMWYFMRVTHVRLHVLLVPTGSDFALYREFARRVYSDGMRLLRPST
ncbi:MAG: hypothetical protein ACXVAO_03320 [Vulcanimicrobiaceae bacterium]